MSATRKPVGGSLAGRSAPAGSSSSLVLENSFSRKFCRGTGLTVVNTTFSWHRLGSHGLRCRSWVFPGWTAGVGLHGEGLAQEAELALKSWLGLGCWMACERLWDRDTLTVAEKQNKKTKLAQNKLKQGCCPSSLAGASHPRALVDTPASCGRGALRGWRWVSASFRGLLLEVAEQQGVLGGDAPCPECSGCLQDFAAELVFLEGLLLGSTLSG